MIPIPLPQRDAWPRRITEAIGRHLFPPACALCSATGKPLCDACSEELDAPLRRTCHQCAITLPLAGLSTDAPCTKTGSQLTPSARPAHLLCGVCLRDRPAFDRSLAAVVYTPPVDQLVLGLKYHAQLAWAPLFAARLGARIRAACAAGDQMPDALLPVPLSRERLAQRGFNQALEIARPLGRTLGLPVMAAAIRIRDTPPQASLPFEARRKNIRGAFYLRPLASDSVNVTGLRIGVVDDVMTTGSTLHELARILKQAGALEVINLVAARTPKAAINSSAGIQA